MNRRGVLPTVHTLSELCGGRNANSVDGMSRGILDVIYQHAREDILCQIYR